MKLSQCKPLVLPIGIAGLVAFLGVGVWLAFRPKPPVVEGRIEATEYNVASKVTGRVLDIPVRIGDRVKKGQLLALIDSPEINARLSQANAALEAAQALQKKAQAGARRQEIENARQQWNRAEEGAKLAEVTLERIRKLYEQGVLPRQHLDEVETQAHTARFAATGARALYEMIVEGTRIEDREAAAAAEKQAAAVVEEIASLKNETRVIAPQDGEVRARIIEKGELAPAGVPIVTLVDLDDIWGVAQVREDYMNNLEIGDHVSARVPALGNREIALSVFFISPQGDYATWRATRQSAGFDLRTFEVRARPAAPVEALRPGMSVIIFGGIPRR